MGLYLLDDIYCIVGVLAEEKIPEINKLVKPNFEYHETYDKENRYFDTTFTIGKINTKNKLFKKFAVKLVLRANQSLHTIDYGRFDLELQALKEHKTYPSCVEGFHSRNIIKKINETLNQFSAPIKSLLEKILGQKFAGINLSSVTHEKYAHLEGGSVLVSAGMIIGSSNVD